MARKQSFGLGRQILAGTVIVYVIVSVLFVGFGGEACSIEGERQVNYLQKGFVLIQTVDT